MNKTEQPPINTNAPIGWQPTYYGSNPPPPSESAARERMRRRRVKGRGGKRDEWAWVVIALALMGVVAIVSTSLFVLLRAVQNQTEDISIAAAQQIPTPVDMRTDLTSGGGVGTGQQVVLDDGRSIVLEPWDGQSRFTMLLMGIDRRPEETGLQYRTDTMMLLSIDPVTHSVGLLSIPRDLFVVVPGYSTLQRVNTPMVLGELNQPGYGPTLAMQTVQYNFGIRVHDYVVVDFDAFITFVDVIGGIDVTLDYTIDDPIYPDLHYGYDPLYMTPGDYHLNGYEALRFARTRHGSSDFERALRQQQVLNAIRDRILDLDLLPSLIVQAPSMYANLSESIYTGLTLEQIISLAWYFRDVSTENIHMGVVDQRYAYNYTAPDGAQVLVPDRSLIGGLMVEIFGENYSE